MHETIIARNIIEEAKKHGSIKSISLEIGELAHIPAWELRDIIREMTGWDVSVSEKKAAVKCKCGFNGNPKLIERGHDFYIIECPKCKSVPKVIEGNKIKIIDVVVE